MKSYVFEVPTDNRLPSITGPPMLVGVTWRRDRRAWGRRCPHEALVVLR